MSETRTSSVSVDCSKVIGDCDHFWGAIGCDYLYSDTLREDRTEAWERLRESAGIRYMRCHYAFSDDAIDYCDDGGGNCYSEDEEGNPVYDWTKMDSIIDRWLELGCRPIMECDYMPKALAADAPDPKFAFPKDYDKYYDLIYNFVKHCRDKYGKEEICKWYWESTNEPDFFGSTEETQAESLKMYDYFAAAATAAEPGIRVGGPASAFLDYIERFLDHATEGKNYYDGSTGSRIDFVSVHSYGLSYFRRDQYPPDARPKVSKILGDAMKAKDTIDRYPSLADVEYLMDEWGAWSVFFITRQEFEPVAIRDGEYLPLFLCKLVDGFFDVIDNHDFKISVLLSWAAFFEMRVKPFCGTRSLFTVGGVKKPVFNAFDLLSRLGNQRLAVSCDEFDSLTRAMATTSEQGEVAVMVYNYRDGSVEECPPAKVFLKLDEMAEFSVCRHFRIDGETSNAYSKWLDMGSPEDPDENQIAELIEADGLAQVDSPEIESGDTGISMALDMPGNSVSLLLFER